MQTRTGHFCNTVKTTNLQKQQRLDRGLHLFWAKKNKAVSARLQTVALTTQHNAETLLNL